MKNQQKVSIYIACFAIVCGLCSCKKTVEQKEVTVDIIVSSDFESSVLSDELQSLYSPSDVFADKEKRTMFVPQGKLSRVDLKTPTELSVKHTSTALENIQRQLKKPTEEDIRRGIKQYLSKVDITSLNSKEKVEKDTKINRIKEFIKQQQGGDAPKYTDVLFYSDNPQNISWNNNVVYHSVDSIRLIVFEAVSSNEKSKFLVVYNPPLEKTQVPIPLPNSITLDKTTLSLTKKGDTAQLTATVLPDNAADKTVTWQSNDEKVATVSETGLVKAEAAGNVEITAYTGNGVSASCKVEVKIGGGDSSGSSSQSSGNGGNRVSVSISGGTYTGETKNKQPHGMGTIRYNTRTLIDSRDTKKRYAEAGEYISGEFYNGRLVQGKLFDSANNHKETIVIGRAN